jgi:hypothetical protein
VIPERRDAAVLERARPLMKQDVRAIDWTSDSTDTVVRKIRAAEGHPWVLDEVAALTSTCSASLASALAPRLASDSHLCGWLDAKRRRRAHDERVKPLQAYRAEEMARARECFFGRDRSYHEARRRFTRKLGAAETTSMRLSSRLAA